MKWILLGMVSTLCADASFVHPHEEIPQYSMHGNFQKGVATKAMGATQVRIYRFGSAILRSSEIFLRGRVLTT